MEKTSFDQAEKSWTHNLHSQYFFGYLCFLALCSIADIQVFENIDNLFDMRDGYFYAVMDCFCENTWSHTPQYKIGYCQQCPDKVQWPIKLGQRPSPYFNAGMFMSEPSQLTFDCLFETLMATVPMPFAEQV